MKSFRIGLLAAVGLTIPLATASLAPATAAPAAPAAARLPAPVTVNGKPCVALPPEKIGIQTYSLPGLFTGTATTVDEANALRVAAAAAQAANQAAGRAGGAGAPGAAGPGRAGGAAAAAPGAAPGGAPGAQAGAGRGGAGAPGAAPGGAPGAAPGAQAGAGRGGAGAPGAAPGAAPAGGAAAGGGRGPAAPPNTALIDSTFARLRQIGYQNIESAGHFNLTAVQLKAALDKAGLKMIGGHDSINANNIDATIEYALASGQNRFVGASGWQYGNSNSIEGVRAAAEGLNAAGRKAFDKGLILYVHNHAQEFTEVDFDLNGDGVTEKVPALEVLMRLTDPRYVALEIDIHWIINAYMQNNRGGEQAALDFIRRNQSRILLYHVKETATPSGAGGGGNQGFMGRGITNWPAWWAAAPNVQYYIFEMDGNPNPLEYATVAYNWLTCRS